MKILAVILGASFVMTNVLMSPVWLLVTLSGCFLGAIEWRRFLKIWLGLSTGQYAIPWWDWTETD